jgi:hypothetical protein
MKLANLFLITGLVAVMAAIGCSDDPPSNGTGGSGGNGTGGSGGTVTDTCTGGFCGDPSEAKTACGLALEYCKSDDCCPGAGGAGGAVDPTDEQCNALGPKICMIDFGGTGGTGGTGGAGGTGGDGTGGTGGTTAAEVCADCENQDDIPLCEAGYDRCTLTTPTEGECAVGALLLCEIA